MNKEILQKRIDEYNNTVQQIFHRKIGNSNIIPYLLHSFERSYDEEVIAILKEVLDHQLIRYKEMQAFLEGYMLGSGTRWNIQFKKIEQRFIPILSDENIFLLDEYELEPELYPDNLISVLHIT